MAGYQEPIVETSLLFNLLPTMISDRLPRLPSLRKSISCYGLRPVQWDAPNPPLPPPPSAPTDSPRPRSGTSTPGEDYSDAMSVQSFGPYEGTRMVLHGRRSLEMSSEMGVEEFKPMEDQSGIHWRYANQGYDLLRVAATESSTVGPQFENGNFSRRLYIHGMTYLMRGLPSDLTEEEQLSIRAAIPTLVVPLVEVKPTQKSPERSVLHRTLASTIVQLFILAQCLLPYVLYLLSAAYQYDREHKVVQRAMQQGMFAVDKLGKSGLAMGSMVMDLGDGKVGQAVGQAAQWIVDGVSGGVQEGVGEVMMIVSSSKVSALQTS